MTDSVLKVFVDEQINLAAQKIIAKGDKSDEIAAGKIDFFIALRSALTGAPGKRELGLLDAVNDTLQHLNLVDARKTFYK